MVNEKVFEFLNKKGFADRIHEHKETIDTVERLWSIFERYLVMFSRIDHARCA